MVDFSIQDRVGVIRLDDGKVNAISHELCASVNEALEEAKRSAGAVALLGRPGYFSAGFDLKEFKKGQKETLALLRAGAQMMLDLFRHPQPVVIGSSGHAIAGGALILLTGDTRIGAAGDFKIGLNEAAIGMVIPEFGMALADHRLSRRHLQAAVIQARIYDPVGAAEAGYLDEVVAPEELEAKTIATAATMAALDAAAYAGNKTDLRAAAIRRLEAAIPDAG